MDKLYYEAYATKSGEWKWKIYKYDTSGNVEIVLHRSTESFLTVFDAEDDCVQFQGDHDLDAEMS